jgi:hypothetical protein
VAIRPQPVVEGCGEGPTITPTTNIFKTPVASVDFLLASTFSVAKRDDIRMVFDASKSKVNEALFAPWLSLATVDAMVRTVDVDYFGADNDYG